MYKRDSQALLPKEVFGPPMCQHQWQASQACQFPLRPSAHPAADKRSLGVWRVAADHPGPHARHACMGWKHFTVEI